MAVESASYVAQLDPTLPQGTQSPKEGDNHIRRIKETLVQTFPNLTGPVSASLADFATLAGSATTGGTPNVTTKTAGDNTQAAASTAFVSNAVASSAAANSGPLVMLALMEIGVI